MNESIFTSDSRALYVARWNLNNPLKYFWNGHYRVVPRAVARFACVRCLSKKSKPNAMRSDTDPRRKHARHARTNRSAFFLSPFPFRVFGQSSFIRRGKHSRAPIRVSQRQSERTSRGELAPCTEPNQQDSSSATLPSKLEESFIFVSLHRHYALTYILHTHHSHVAVWDYLTTTFFFFVLYRVALVVLLCLVLSSSRSLFRSLYIFASCFFCRSLVTSYSN